MACTYVENDAEHKAYIYIYQESRLNASLIKIVDEIGNPTCYTVEDAQYWWQDSE